jgi:signal peptidase I
MTLAALSLTAALALAAATAALLTRARRHLVTVTVEGMSMSPAYLPGDRVLVSRRTRTRAASGQVVVVERPHPVTGWSALPPLGRDVEGREWYIKRVAAVAGEPVPTVVRKRRGLPDDTTVAPGHLVVLGEHPLSEDSKQWGALPVDRVLGVVLRKL